ncbi:MAG: DUF1080 domain-containing protein [Planctomycetes bacterium]|nr:DUF1080 domain-containing protein [Planctomycetota bacterium]
MRYAYWPFLFMTVFAVATSAAEPKEEVFTPLFNGEDLTGWVRTNTPPETWTFNEGMLVCSGKPVGELRTEQMYQNFIMELEWRHMVPKGNAGVFIWADDITARGVPFHRGIEVQVLENAYGNTRSHTTHGDIFPIHGATMTPVNGRGGSRAFPTEERSNPSPEWNHYRIVCQDGAISLAVNGKVVTKGKDCSPRKGYICLESEGGIVHYRNVRIKELPNTPVDPKQVAIANRGYRSIYNGLDLSGWTGQPETLKAWRASDWVLAFSGPRIGIAADFSTSERFGDVGFVFDAKIKENGESLHVRVRNAAIDTTDAEIAKHLDPVGRWNRFEGTLRDNRLTLTVNGHEAFKDQVREKVTDRGPITISATGPTDLANIYVRDLSVATK